MRILAILIAGQMPDQSTQIFTREYDLSSIGMMARGTVKDTFKFVARESLNGLEKGSRHKAKHEEYYVYIQVANTQQVAAYAFCDDQYPIRVIYQCLRNCLESFYKKVGETWKTMKDDENVPVPEIKQFFTQYQDPKNVDKVLQAQSIVDETKIVLHENIQKLLERQGDLDHLIEKSKDLSKNAKILHKQSKQMNKKCCIIF